MRFLSTFITSLLIPLLAVFPIQAETALPTGSIPQSQTGALQIRLADAAQSVVEAATSVKGYAILVTDAAGSPVQDAAVAIRLPDEGATGFFQNGERSAVAYTNAAGLASFTQINWGPALGSALVRITVVKGEQHAGALIEQTIVDHSASVKTAAPAVVKPLPTQTATIAKPVHPAAGAASGTAAVTPGTPVSVATVHSGASGDATTPEPVVSIVNTSGSAAPHSNKKWVVLALVGAAAGVGAALALSGKGAAAASSTPSTGLSIGAPSISVGH